MVEATAGENRVTAALGATVVGGVYVDGWAHVNSGGIETFFTPWHAILYGAFTLLTGWLAGMVWRRRHSQPRWRSRVPTGYGWGWIGIALFATGGLADMLWHLAFGIEVGIDALVSPTHLLLLAGGALLISSPVRAARPTFGVSSGVHAWPVVISLAAVTSLAGFFLSYVSVFVDPLAREPLSTLPETDPGHRLAELPAITGLAGYLVGTVLLVGPLLYLLRRARLPRGAVTVLVAAVAVPAAMLSQLAFAAPALGAVLGAAVMDVILALRPDLPAAVAVALVPGLVWSGQLVGLAGVGDLRWPVELWSGVVVLAVLLAVGLDWLTGRSPGPAGTLWPPRSAATPLERQALGLARTDL